MLPLPACRGASADVAARVYVRQRPERSGLGNGRVYTITYQVEDASGNTTEAQAIVTVPKSQKKL